MRGDVANGSWGSVTVEDRTTDWPKQVQKKRLQHYSQTYQHRVDQFEADVPRTIFLIRPVITISVGVTTRCPEDAFGSIITGPTIGVNLTWKVFTGNGKKYIKIKR